MSGLALLRRNTTRRRIVPAGETFTGANGSLPTGWTAALPNGGSADIQDNALRVVSPTSAYKIASASRAGFADAELLVSVTITSTAENYPMIGFRASAGFTGGGYAIQLYPEGSQIFLLEYTNGSDAHLAAAAVSLGIGTYKVRVRWQGSVLQARVWLATNSEPGTWTVAATDSTYTVADRIILGGMSGNSGAAFTAIFDDLTVTQLSSATGGLGVAPLGTSPIGG